MKLEVGMYVRTKWGINKINEYVPQSGQLYLKTDVCVKSNVLKASYNIIDLIEIGDYVNGEPVILVEKYAKVNHKQGTCLIQTDTYDINDNEQFLIKSIVTKEQFESMQYKVD